MTFEDMKTEMGTWLSADTTRLPTVTRGVIINICQRELLRTNNLRFGEVTTDIVTANGTPDYSLPTGWSHPYSLWYYSSGKTNVDYRTKEEFDIIYPNATAKGDPIHYTVWGNKVYFGPTPNAVFNVHANYYRVLPDLSDGSPNNTNAFVENAWEAIFFRSLWYATKFMIEDARESVWASMAQLFENKLIIEHARARSAGRRPVTREAGFVGGPVFSG